METRFLSELALTHPEIRGVIGWIDLYDSETANNIREFQQYVPIRGYLTEALRDRRPTLPVMELLRNQYSSDLSIGHESDPDVLTG